VGSRTRTWSALLVFGALALMLGGCGSLSPSLRTESAVLAARSQSTAFVDSAAAPVQIAAQVPTQIMDEFSEGAAAPEPAASVSPSSITVETMTSDDAPSWFVALAGPVDAALRGTPEPTPPDYDVEEYDPWEKFNEKMFNFNYKFDKNIFKPAAKGYNAITPDIVQQMIDNAFTNLNMPVRFVNKVLQWKLKGAAIEMSRFLINSTLGVGGLFDVAKQEFKLQPQKADFGQTLGRWGTGPGPYLVLPFFPPLTVRDGIGFVVDGFMSPLGYYIPFFPDKLAMNIGDRLNDRSLNLDLFQGFEDTTIDLYSSVRNGYLQRRDRLIKGDDD
jgi:phospholipid-binding lipoprotein MlaA